MFKNWLKSIWQSIQKKGQERRKEKKLEWQCKVFAYANAKKNATAILNQVNEDTKWGTLQGKEEPFCSESRISRLQMFFKISPLKISQKS